MDKSLPPTYYFPNMASEQVLLEYNHPVNVSVESGELLGLGHFVGAARINRATGGRGGAATSTLALTHSSLSRRASECRRLSTEKGSTHSEFDADSPSPHRSRSFLRAVGGTGSPVNPEAIL